MVVGVQTRDESGTQLAAAKNTAYQTDVFAQYGAQANQEIARIVEENMPLQARPEKVSNDSGRDHGSKLASLQ